MAFQADGSAIVALSNPIILPSTSAWTWSMRVQKTSDSEMVAGEDGNSRPFIGFFGAGGVPSVRFNNEVSGTGTYSLSGTYTIGDYYDFVLSHDGAGTITFSVGAESTTIPQTADITIDLFLDYGARSLPYSGITEGVWSFIGATGGDRTYDWDQPEGTTTLVETSQGLDESITNITSGGFIAEQGEDTTPPSIVLQGDNPLTLVQGNSYVEPGYTASDNVDGDLTGSVVVGGDTVDGNTLGTYNITYTVSDAAGNATQVDRVVNVVEAGAATITVTSIGDYEFKSWDENQQAQFTVSGTIDGSVGPVEVSVDGTNFTTLDSGTSNSFSGVVIVTGQQDITVRLTNDNSVSSTVAGVSAGLVIVEGPSQSNGDGRGISLQTPTFDPAKPMPIMWKSSSGFEAIQDPTGITPQSAGSMWPHIAKLYSDAGIPVCICNVAQGGTELTQWQPGTSYYGRITNAYNALGGIGIVTTLIGETDSDLGTSTELFKSRYLAIADQLVADFDVLIYATYFPVGDSTGAGYPAIRQAYDELISENDRIVFGGDLSVIDIDTSTSAGNDGLHIKQDADLEQAANIRYAALTADFSLFSASVSGIPDGSHELIYFEVPDVGSVNLSTPSGVVLGTASSGQISFTADLPMGTKIVAYVPGDNPPNTGGAIYGVTS